MIYLRKTDGWPFERAFIKNMGLHQRPFEKRENRIVAAFSYTEEGRVIKINHHNISPFDVSRYLFGCVSGVQAVNLVLDFDEEGGVGRGSGSMANAGFFGFVLGTTLVRGFGRRIFRAAGVVGFAGRRDPAFFAEFSTAKAQRAGLAFINRPGSLE